MLKYVYKSPLFKSAGIYTFSNLLNSAIPFLLLPVLTRVLSPQDYGTSITFQLLSNLFLPFIGLNLQSAIAREYYDKSESNFSVYLSNVLIILLFSCLFFSALVYSFSSAISSLAVFPAEWLWSVIFYAASHFISLMALTIWQVKVKPVLYGSFQISQTFLIFVLSIYFVVVLKRSWQGFVEAQLIIKGIYAVISVIILARHYKLSFKFDLPSIKTALKFGTPLIPHVLGGWLRASGDRILINNIVSVAANGIYSAGYQLTLIITLLENSFINAWTPWFYEKLKLNDPKINRRIVKISYLFVFFCLSFSLIYALTAPYLFDIFLGKDYRTAKDVVLFLALSKGIDSIYFMTVNYLFYLRKTSIIATITFTFSTLHFVLAFFFISDFGYIGASQVAVITSLAIAITTGITAYRLYKMPWNLKH